MKRWLLAAGLAVGVAGGGVFADDPKKPDAIAKSDNPFAEIEKERSTKRGEMIKAYRAAKDDERDKIYKDWQKADGELAKKLTELAFEKATTPEAYSHLVLASMTDNDSGKKAIELIGTHHIDKPYVAKKDALRMLATSKAGAKLVDLVEAKNPSAECKAAAALAIAMDAKDKFGTVKREEKKAEFLKMAKAALARVGTYEVGTNDDAKAIKRQAKGLLAGIDNLDKLVVGKEAPDIDGVDVDGKAFKLSDYRGKVVLLDFWAFW